MISCRRAAGALLSCALALSAPCALAQYVSLVDGPPPVQDFNSLAASGTSSQLPDGWYFSESGTNADSRYGTDDGSANSGNTYSYGASGSSDRAFGTLLSGSLKPTIGVRLRNDSGLIVEAIDVAFTAEQWRLGAGGRSDRLQAQYSLDASVLNDSSATWVNVSALDVVTPNPAASPGALDGNAAANRTAINASISGLVLADGDSLWLRWVDKDVSGIDDGLAIDDISFGVSGTPPVDVPPTVVATSPVDNAIDVTLASSLTVDFSEDVAIDDPWFTLQCSISGAHTATVTGGPRNYSLSPRPAFTADETCEWSILASGVTDLDGTPDPLAADYSVHFATLNPANLPAPSVESTMPADGATGVPIATSVQVIFSEVVTTDADAFSLACAGSPISISETGSGDQRTLIPASVLPATSTCTFTVHADAVRNANDIAMVTDVTATFATAADAVGNYFEQVNTSSPEQLRCSLHAVIRDHVVYPYSGSGTNTWTILEIAQASPSNPSKILDVYRNRVYNAVSDRAGTGSGLTYNREHTWPNSLGFPSREGDMGLPNAPYTDTHMLYLSDTNYNSDRGNKPYAFCGPVDNCGERSTEVNNGVGGGTGIYPGNSNWVNGNSFETWNYRKGDTARAIMYMAIRYEGGSDSNSGQGEPDLELTDIRSLIVGTSDYSHPSYMGLLTDLLAWHAADPPDAEEITRDQVIYSFQGNRNPFINHPEWATRALFESSQPLTCILNEGVIFRDGFDGN